MIASKRRLQLLTSAAVSALVLGLGLIWTTYAVRHFRDTLERRVAEDNRIIGENLSIIIRQVTREYVGRQAALSKFQKVLEGLGTKGWVGFACVLDKDGRVLAHPRPDALGMQAPLDRYEPTALLGSQSPPLRGLPSSQPEAETAVYRTEADIIAVQWLPEMMTYLCVHQSVAPMNAVARRLRNRLGLIGALFLAASAVGSWLFVGRLVDRYESSLAHSEAKNSALVANSSPILVTGQNGAILEANQQALDLFGVSREAILLMTAADFWPHERKAQLAEILKDLRPSQAVELHDLDLRTADGRNVPVDLRACRIAYGDLDAAYFLIRDVTETRRAQQEMVEANRQLQELDQLKTDFLNTVSHELRTPLTSIKWSAESLAQMLGNRPDPNLQRLLTIVRDDNQRLTTLIEQLLNFSRLDAGRLETRVQDVHTGDLLRRVTSEVTPIAAKKQIDLRLTGDASAPVCPGDPEQLHQVFVNLLDNAIKYTPEAGKVSVEMRATEDEIQVTVRDNGIGIPEADIPNIFNKFYRAEDTQARQQRGTGIGLAVVRGILDAHGGKVEVESRPGDGSAFRVRLPRPT